MCADYRLPHTKDERLKDWSLCIHPTVQRKVFEAAAEQSFLHCFGGQALGLRHIVPMGPHLETAGRGGLGVGLRMDFSGRVCRAADIRLTLAAHALLHLHDLGPQVGHGVLVTHILLGLPDLLQNDLNYEIAGEMQRLSASLRIAFDYPPTRKSLIAPYMEPVTCQIQIQGNTPPSPPSPLSPHPSLSLE